MKDVYICDSAYHVLIALIKIFTKENNNEVKMVLCTNDVLPADVIDRIRKLKEINETSIYSNLEKIDPTLDYSANFFKRGESLKKQLDDAVDFPCSSSEEYYVFNDNSILGKYLNAHKIKYNLIEDGLNVYRLQTVISNNYTEPLYKKKLRQLFNAGFYCYGQSIYSKTIEVNSSEGLIINIPKKKLIVRPRKDMLLSLSQENKRKILNIFLNDEEINKIEKSLQDMKEGAADLLITQPLFSDRITSKEEHINFYKDLVDKYSDGKLVIKPHPRDRIDYTSIFPEAVIIPYNYLPIETLGFFEGCSFKHVLTWCSTSIEGIDYCQDKIVMGIDYIKPYLVRDKANGFESQWSYAKNLV